jgi:hypothetical protein
MNFEILSYLNGTQSTEQNPKYVFCSQYRRSILLRHSALSTGNSVSVVNLPPKSAHTRSVSCAMQSPEMPVTVANQPAGLIDS